MFGSASVFSSNPVLEFFWWMLMFYLFFMVIMLFVRIFADIFHRDNLSGWGKAGWIILLFILPFLGAIIYMIARPKNTEQDQRDMAEAQATQARLQGGSALDDIAKAQALLDKNAITQAEFEAIKAKALAQ
jgi:Na+/proline symporter